jgi:excisionase family DNA binding protein
MVWPVTIDGLEGFDWLGADEVARLLGVGTRQVRKWADDGVLPCLRTDGGHRRFRRRDVDTFLEARLRAGAVS